MEICILDTDDLLKAQLAQSKLEACDIPSEIRSNDAGGSLPQLRFAEGIQLYVSEENAKKAKERLSQED